jgi:hypothetical protein
MALFDDPADSSLDLSRFDDAYSRITPTSATASSPGDDLPDGFYETQIEEARLGKAARSGHPMITFRLRITSGDHRGRLLVKNSFITDKSLPIVKDELARLNLNLDRFSELPVHLAQLSDKAVSVFKKRDGDWVRIYFTRSQSTEPMKDDLPF